MSELPPPDGLSDAQKRRARQIAAIVFVGTMTAWVLGTSFQIVQQAIWPEAVATPWPTCEEGLRGLHSSLERARHDAEGDLDPDSALARFRAGLSPEWTYLAGVRKTCGEAHKLPSLDALERLRYAEEHAVRREAASLAALRRRVASEVAPR
ncbi:MAG: hypothetical protein HOW73_10785 [Polyangiaceae bacterium]|nr:hypothetical protein [Polyangiaceae bacterium]